MRVPYPCKNDLWLEFHQIGGVGLRSFWVTGEPAIFNLDLAALGPAELPEAFPKRGNAGLSFRIAFRKIHQHADPSYPRRAA